MQDSEVGRERWDSVICLFQRGLQSGRGPDCNQRRGQTGSSPTLLLLWCHVSLTPRSSAVGSASSSSSQHSAAIAGAANAPQSPLMSSGPKSLLCIKVVRSSSYPEKLKLFQFHFQFLRVHSLSIMLNYDTSLGRGGGREGDKRKHCFCMFSGGLWL